jgi:hypothetical protein
VHILKYPPLSKRRLVCKIGCAQRGAAGSSAGAAVKEAEMRRMQLGQKIAHGFFKAVRRIGRFDQGPVVVYSGAPIAIQLFRLVETLVQGSQHLVENGAAVVLGKLRRRDLSRLIHRHLELLEMRLTAGAGKRLPRGLPTSTKPAQ